MAMVRSQNGRRADIVAQSIHELCAEDAESVAQFNERLARAGVTFRFPTSPADLVRSPESREEPYQRAYVLSVDSVVRGGYILKSERLFAGEAELAAGNYQLPLSEGIIARQYAMVGLQLLKDALRRQPRLYCLGMGGMSRPLPQMLKRLSWDVSEVPFLFRIEDPSAFRREIRWLRQRNRLRLLLDTAYYSGMLSAVVRGGRLRRRLTRIKIPADASIDSVRSLPGE